VDGEQLGGGAGAVERAPRLLQFDPLNSVGGQDGDLLALVLV
jgi:hypothetical protein